MPDVFLPCLNKGDDDDDDDDDSKGEEGGGGGGGRTYYDYSEDTKFSGEINITFYCSNKTTNKEQHK